MSKLYIIVFAAVLGFFAWTEIQGTKDLNKQLLIAGLFGAIVLIKFVLPAWFRTAIVGAALLFGMLFAVQAGLIRSYQQPLYLLMGLIISLLLNLLFALMLAYKDKIASAESNPISNFNKVDFQKKKFQRTLLIGVLILVQSSILSLAIIDYGNLSEGYILLYILPLALSSFLISGEFVLRRKRS